jgi:hypothetical protein
MHQLDMGFAAPCSQPKASRHHEQLIRAWAFLRERVRSEAEGAQLDAELEAQLAEGPRYHRGSSFTDVPRINCDRNFLAKVLFIARAIERGSYKVRSKGKHGGALGRSALAVLEVLINMARARQGKLAPSHPDERGRSTARKTAPPPARPPSSPTQCVPGRPAEVARTIPQGRSNRRKRSMAMSFKRTGTLRCSLPS